jgi:hypothetical protein
MFGNFRRYIFEAIIMAVRKLSGETPSCYVTFDIASLLKQSKGRNVDSYPEVRFSVEAVNNNFIVFCTYCFQNIVILELFYVWIDNWMCMKVPKGYIIR